MPQVQRKAIHRGCSLVAHGRNASQTGVRTSSVPMLKPHVNVYGIDLFFFLGRPLTTIQHPVSTSGDHSTFLNPMSSSVPLQNVYYERVCPSPLSLLDPLKLTRGRRRKSRPPNHATSVVDRLGPCSRRSRPMTSCIPVMPISPTRQPFPIHQLPLPMCLCDSSGL